MLPELLQPGIDVLKSAALGNVIDDKGTVCPTVIGTGDGPIALLAGGVPDLGLNGLAVDLDSAVGKLHANGRLAFHIKLITGEAH